MQGDLLIQNNANVETITGFDALRGVGGNVSFGGAALGDGNAALTDAPALKALTSIGSNLLIGNNVALTTAPVLSALASLGGNFTVQGNTQLSECCALLRAIEEVVTSGATTTISGNNTGCDSQRAVEVACTPIIIGTDLAITADGEVPDNVTEITRITGNLEISGTITEFPDFAILKVVEGNITISDITTAGLTTLSDIFPVLDSVYGNLVIQNQRVVETIGGFVALDTIGGNLSINDNALLRSIPTFDAIIGVGRDINIQTNAALPTISGFANLESVGSIILISDNANLTTLSGFDVLETVTGCLEIGNFRSDPAASPPIIPTGNSLLTSLPSFSELTEVGCINIVESAVLTTLPPFASLTSIGNDLFINNNAKLATVSGFGALTSIGNDLFIHSNPELVTLSTFGALISVGGDINIQTNAKLPVISGFGALTTLNGSLTVTGNAALSLCCGLLSIADGSLVPGGSTTDISGNATGCSSKTEITNSCSAALTINVPADVTAELETLQGIRGDLTIGGTITAFPTFAALRVVEGNLTIRGLSDASLTALTDIFPLLTELHGNLLIQNNANVETIRGFDALNRVDGNVEIGGVTSGDGNAALTDAPALNALRRIGGDLIIGNNVALTTAPALRTIASLGGNLTVRGNTALSSCCGLLPLVNGTVDPGGMTIISGNGGSECDDPGSIEIACKLIIIDTDLTISTDTNVPGRVTRITRIRGNLTINGAITEFPDFAILEVVEGNLTINGLSDASLTDLTGIFPLLFDVQDDLRIQNNANVETITGFDALTRVGSSGDEFIGDLIIRNNTSLTTISGFGALIHIGKEGGIRFAGDMFIHRNPELVTLPTFPELIRVDQDINIQANAKLPTISGFVKLKNVGRNLLISDNDNLTAISGFDVLETIDGIEIGNFRNRPSATPPVLPTGNPLLTSVPSFSAVTRVRCINFVKNDVLTTISGFPSLTTIDFDLYILDNASLTTVSGFDKVDIIKNDILILENPVLVTLPTFPELVRVGRDLNIQNNVALPTISGFVKLERVGRFLIIAGNDKMTTVSGFDGMETVGRSFGFIDNLSLTSLPSFDALQTIDNNLGFTNNAALTSLPSFDALDSIGETLTITNNASLPTLSGFEALTRLDSTIEVSGNPLLTTVSGFAKLNTIGKNFDINNNPLLTTISGFDVLKNIGEELSISDNDVLYSCCGLLRIAQDDVTVGGTTAIFDNATGCSSKTEIIRFCLESLVINTDADVPADVSSLRRITQSLFIRGTITSFPNFAALEVVEGNITISGITTNTLTDLNNIFPVLDSLRGNLTIENNNHVQTLSGFSALDSVGGNLSINDNTSLTTLPAFDVLTRIEGALSINDNTSLTTLPTFDVLTSVNSLIIISTNAALATVSGFGALERVGIGFIVTDNAVLATLSGFGALTSLGGDLTVRNNVQLASCCGLLRLVDGTVQHSGRTTIFGNATGCESGDAIEQACGDSNPNPTNPLLGLPAVDESLRFYPNPASQTLYIEGISQETSLLIRTFSGQTLLRTTLRQNQAIDLTVLHQNLPQGVYLLTLQNAQEQITRRLVIGL